MAAPRDPEAYAGTVADGVGPGWLHDLRATGVTWRAVHGDELVGLLVARDPAQEDASEAQLGEGTTKRWRSQRELNPRYRRERPAS